MSQKIDSSIIWRGVKKQHNHDQCYYWHFLGGMIFSSWVNFVPVHSICILWLVTLCTFFCMSWLCCCLNMAVRYFCCSQCVYDVAAVKNRLTVTVMWCLHTNHAGSRRCSCATVVRYASSTPLTTLLPMDCLSSSCVCRPTVAMSPLLRRCWQMNRQTPSNRGCAKLLNGAFRMLWILLSRMHPWITDALNSGNYFCECSFTQICLVIYIAITWHSKRFGWPIKWGVQL